MNHRIQELADQAGSTHKQNLGVYQFYSDELQKFAELIIRECAKVAVDCDVIEYSDFRQGIAQEIKQHFGVQ